MKLILVSILAAILCACSSTPATVTVDGITATSSKKLGGKQMIYVKKGETVVAIGDNNEKSFQDATSLGKFGIGAWALTDIFSTGASTYQSVKNSATKSSVESTALKESTKQIGLKEATTQKGMELEAAALVAGE